MECQALTRDYRQLLKLRKCFGWTGDLPNEAGLTISLSLVTQSRMYEIVLNLSPELYYS